LFFSTDFNKELSIMQQIENFSPDKRRYPRIQTSIPMNLMADKRNVSAETLNLSINGVCCRVNRPIAMMTSLEVILMLPDEGSPDDLMYVECNGIVVRNEEKENGHHISIYFNEIELDEIQKLAAYIAAHGSYTVQ
jgi:c-di-GMP-binding flagellar brake protein YcgR